MVKKSTDLNSSGNQFVMLPDNAAFYGKLYYKFHVGQCTWVIEKYLLSVSNVLGVVSGSG
jgi:hypothetical protein